MDTTLHKEAVMKVILNPWLEEAYTFTGNIEGRLATLQVMQQKHQPHSAGTVTEKIVEDTK